VIRIAFFLNFPLDYKGGINYFRNLLYAINKYPEGQETTLFVPENIPDDYIKSFSPYAKIVKTPVIQRGTKSWFIGRVLEKTLGINPLMKRLVAKHKIDVVSHSNFTSKTVKTINWIPDFQYLHYPNLWSQKRLRDTTVLNARLISRTDLICVSSNDALNDLKSQHAADAHKAFVLHFVSQPEKGMTVDLSPSEKSELFNKYNIDRPYFYLPNQFWVHKNHKVVWRAVKRLKEQGLEPLVVTSGHMSDSRTRDEHLEELKKFIDDNGLTKNIYLLGLIPYGDVIRLLIGSACVINPSHFEGWSSTVEESKTLGKRIILSNIGVHIEQKPEFGIYFSPDDDAQLASIMTDVVTGKLPDIKVDKESVLNSLEKRTKEFAHSYLAAVKQLANKN
jgi:glycosyltransferase involved in cell wall biosynthesis